MRRGQIEFGESLMVVIVLVFIITIGLVFYYNVSKASVIEEAGRVQDVDAIIVAKRVLSLPEVGCDRYSGETCIDALKLKALADIINKQPAKAYYEEYFGYATITINYVHNGEDFLLYNETPPSNVSQSVQFIFTTLYDPLTDTKGIAYLNVTRYRQEVRI